MKFPTSNSSVRVRMVDTTTEMTIRAESFVKPVQKGHETLNITDVAFLIEHDPSGKKVMYATSFPDYIDDSAYFFIQVRPWVQKRLLEPSARHSAAAGRCDTRSTCRQEHERDTGGARHLLEVHYFGCLEVRSLKHTSCCLASFYEGFSFI